MKIVTVPNPVLQTKVFPIKLIDLSIRKIIKDMIVALENQTDPQGVGLAAPQIGKPLAIFIIKPRADSKISVFINPSILTLEMRSKKLDMEVGSGKTEMGNVKKKSSTHPRGGRTDSSGLKNRKTKLEGCLSIPKIWGRVTRSDKVLLEYMDEKGKHQKKWFSGFEAIIIQHEMDHLSGTLFTQRVLEQKGKLYREQNGELERYEI